MKILFMVFHFPPISGGGVIVIVELANQLAELGNDVTILTPKLDWNGEIYNPSLNPRISIIRVETPSKNNMKVAARRCYFNMKEKAGELIKDSKYDFILTIFHPFHLVPKAAVACGQKYNIPVIVKIDDAIYAKSKGLKSIQRIIEKKINSKTLRNASRILVSNESTRNLVNKYYKIATDKISIVPNGVDIRNFYSNMKESSNQIIFSGVMYHHRGVDVLLESASIVIEKIPDVQFVLLGSGPEMEKLVEFTKKYSLSKNVKFLGWIDRKQIPEYLAKSAIGVGPLRVTDVTKDALPIKILEYMASYLPILAKRGTLSSDILIDGENGFFVKDTNELAEKIIYLLQNQNVRSKMGQKSRDIVEKYDWKIIAQSIIDEYNKCKD
jgi:glycosyltransferase involved in cell wall biosynthesis